VVRSLARLVLISTTSVTSLLCLELTLSNSATLVTQIASSAACSSLKITAFEGLGGWLLLWLTVCKGTLYVPMFVLNCLCFGILVREYVWCFCSFLK
jgi:hypothetical protein